MRKEKIGAIAIIGFALLAVLGAATPAMAHDGMNPYPNMATAAAKHGDSSYV